MKAKRFLETIGAHFDDEMYVDKNVCRRVPFSHKKHETDCPEESFFQLRKGKTMEKNIVSNRYTVISIPPREQDIDDKTTWFVYDLIKRTSVAKCEDPYDAWLQAKFLNMKINENL